MAIERQYWDSCCFIAIVNDETGRVDHLKALWDDAAVRGKARILTSALTIAECAHAQGERSHQEQLDAFFLSRSLTIVSLDRIVGNEARDLQRAARDTYGKKLPVRDALHMAAALRANADRMFTYDEDDLIPLSRLFKTQAGNELVIEVPKWVGTIEMTFDR